jgi:hypothetical protein
MRSNFFTLVALLIACGSLVCAQEPEAKQLLARALHLADIYNWADAAPAFTQAEELFGAAGDQRNGLYAKLGRIRSNIERTSKRFQWFPHNSQRCWTMILFFRTIKSSACSAS